MRKHIPLETTLKFKDFCNLNNWNISGKDNPLTLLLGYQAPVLLAKPSDDIYKLDFWKNLTDSEIMSSRNTFGDCKLFFIHKGCIYFARNGQIDFTLSDLLPNQQRENVKAARAEKDSPVADRHTFSEKPIVHYGKFNTFIIVKVLKWKSFWRKLSFKLRGF